MLIKEIPTREISRLKTFNNIDDIYRKDKLSAFNNMNITTYKEIENYYLSQEEKPRYCYILHESKDGKLAAEALSDEINEQYNLENEGLNPCFKEDVATSYLKKAQLKAVAKKSFLWKHESIINLKFIGKLLSLCITSVISILGIVLSLSNFGIEVLSAFKEQFTWISIFIINLVFSLISVLVFFSIKKDADNKSFQILNSALTKMTDEQFLDFIEQFEDTDFVFSDYTSNVKGTDISICFLGDYSLRQKYILKQFWTTNTNSQLWWIFIERKKKIQKYIINKSEINERKFFYLKPLTLKEKKILARKLEINPKNPILKSYGVDYICRYRLKSSELSDNNNNLEDRISTFISIEKTNNINIKYLISLVAELSINYNVDFSDVVNWEYLFDYKNKTSKIVNLDRNISKSLLFYGNTKVTESQLNQLKIMVESIIKCFFEDFNDILAMNSYNSEITDYLQLCIIKALRCRGKVAEDCLVAIAQALFGRFNSRENFSNNDVNSNWIEIIIETLNCYYKNSFYWYSPAIIHILIRICDASTQLNIKNIFSLPVVLNTARTNLLLNINNENYIENDDEQSQAIDVIYDHYRITEYAVKEKNFQLNKVKTNNIPDSFGLLNFNNSERREYYGFLCLLKENEALDYYDYMYDIFCACLQKNDEMNLCNISIFKNNIQRKYFTGYSESQNSRESIKKIICSMIEQIMCVFENNSEIKKDFFQIKNLFKSKDSTFISQYGLFLLAKSDAMGLDTISFIACMACRMNDTEDISREIYLNSSSYLIQLIFLSYHEMFSDSFFNEDFKYLISLLTNYLDPADSILGYLAWLNTMAKPQESTKVIRECLEHYKERYIEYLIQALYDYKLKDFEEMLHFLYCSNGFLDDDSLNKIYNEIRAILHSNYNDSSKALILDELISLIVDGHSNDVFSKRTPEELLSDLNNYSPNLVYEIYNEYDKLNYDIIKNNCHIVAKKIIDSTFVNKHLLILQYIFDKEECDSDSVIETMKLVYSDLKKELKCSFLLSNKLYILKCYLLFIKILKRKFELKPNLYNWVDRHINSQMFNRISENEQYILYVESKEFFKDRIWKKYGMLLFLKYLLESSLLPYEHNTEYENMNAAEKIEYIKENYNDINPFIYSKNNKSKNHIYIDMINVFIKNEHNIQEFQNEYDCLMRFAEDAYSVIEVIFEDHPSRKKQIDSMIDSYISTIQKL
jgi:hypothetical protein